MAYRDGGGAVIDRAGTDGWATAAAAPSIIPALPRNVHDEAPPHIRPGAPELPRCPEIECVRYLLPPSIFALAELRAAEAGVGADRVLLAWGVITEETYVAVLAASLDIAFEPLRDKSRGQCPLPDKKLIHAATTGMLPLFDGNDVNFVVAPRLVDSRRLVAVAMSGGDVTRRIRLTSTARLQDFVARHGAAYIERQAVDELRVEHPQLSAGAGRPRLMAVAICALVAVAVAIASPHATHKVVELALGTVFLAWTATIRWKNLISNSSLSRTTMRRARRSTSCGWDRPSRSSSRRRADRAPSPRR